MTLSDWMAIAAVVVTCAVACAVVWTTVLISSLQQHTAELDDRLTALEESLAARPVPVRPVALGIDPADLDPSDPDAGP